MKILLISGHGAGDPGAIGNGYKEADLTREVVNNLAPKLRQYATVDVYPQDRDAYSDVNKGNVAVNFANYNYVFEVHFNAGGGDGTEIWVTREEAQITVEEKILSKLSQYFNNRGVKRKNFNVIARAKRSGVSSALLETCFIDNANNVNTYKSNVNGICQAICDGIAEGFGLKNNGTTNQTIQPTKKSNEEIAAEVWAGKWGTGEERKNRLQAEGYDYNTIQGLVNKGVGKNGGFTNSTSVPSKSALDVAREIWIKGNWGTGDERKRKVEAAGYNYAEVQKYVNEFASGKRK